MKKFTLLFAAFILTYSSQAQIFSDNFDGYLVGSYLGPQSAEWKTYTTTGEGTIEDALITNAQSLSASNSILLQRDFANNDPQNVVLDFMQMYSSGVFKFQSGMYVVGGHSAKFNLQGSTILGSLKTIDVQMEYGKMTIQSDAITVLECSHPSNSWFTLEIEANLTTKIWEVKINGISEGKWKNAFNTLTYLNIHPTVNDIFYMDDVALFHTPYTASNLNATAATLKKGGGELATHSVQPKLLVVNTGLTAIQSLDVQIEYNGSIQNQQFTGLNIASNSSVEVALPLVTFVATSGFLKAKINAVNGVVDDLVSDNVSQLYIEPIVPAFGKRVVSEERTGTWCEYCPMGHYFMEKQKADYDPFWVGISIHNGDPMQDNYYNSSVSTPGYPWVFTDRITGGATIAAIEKKFLQQVQISPTALINVGALYNPVTRELNISGSFNFIASANENYKAAFVLTEDGVTGTASGYQQQNAYAGGLLGPMGGYEALPDPVPANMMTYNHVARTIKPSYNGFTGSFPVLVPSGSQHAVNQYLTLPNSWDENEINIIVLLIDPSGKIDNAGTAKIQEAIANGFVEGTSTSGVGLTEIKQIDETFALYPNPASTSVTMTFNLKSESTVAVRVLDLTGKEIASRAYGSMNGSSHITYNTSDLKSGIYFVEVIINGERINRRLVIE
jgi:hypothetical protein